jgi:hypothetical protein
MANSRAKKGTLTTNVLRGAISPRINTIKIGVVPIAKKSNIGIDHFFNFFKLKMNPKQDAPSKIQRLDTIP